MQTDTTDDTKQTIHKANKKQATKPTNQQVNKLQEANKSTGKQANKLESQQAHEKASVTNQRQTIIINLQY